MREYITEKMKNTPKHFRFGNIEVEQNGPIPEGIDIDVIFRTLESHLPLHYFDELSSIKIGHLDIFDKKSVNAVYKDKTFYITNKQSNTKDLVNDLVHEFAHHMETLFPEKIYSDRALIKEFLKKRQELKYELQTEGYWVDEYDFKNLKFNSDFDIFLYKRVGRNMLRMVTAGSFIRPYAAVSLREYFATGFEAYYTGREETLERISPVLFSKITDLHNHRPR